MKKIIEVKLPDGARFFSDSHDVRQAASAAKKYLCDHNIAQSNRPLTEFTCHEMTDEEYERSMRKKMIKETFIFYNIEKNDFGEPFLADIDEILVPKNCVLYKVVRMPHKSEDYKE